MTILEPVLKLLPVGSILVSLEINNRLQSVVITAFMIYHIIIEYHFMAFNGIQNGIHRTINQSAVVGIFNC